MDYITFPPCEELKEFISHFWILRQDRSKHEVPAYYLTANSMTELTFFFSNESHIPELLFTSIQGQTDKAQQLPANSLVDILGVSIFPYSIPYLFGIPAREINNLSIPIKEILGESSEIISESISNATTDKSQINILSKYFTTVLAGVSLSDRRIIQAVHEIKRKNGNVDIKTLSNKICLSERQFERQFAVNVGFTPKLYSRIVRFESALNSLAYIDSFTEVAYMNGYYDQAHFIREFKAFSALSPTEYFSMLPT